MIHRPPNPVVLSTIEEEERILYRGAGLTAAAMAAYSLALFLFASLAVL